MELALARSADLSSSNSSQIGSSGVSSLVFFVSKAGSIESGLICSIDFPCSRLKSTKATVPSRFDRSICSRVRALHNFQDRSDCVQKESNGSLILRNFKKKSRGSLDRKEIQWESVLAGFGLLST